MIKLMKYLKKSAGYIVLIIALLFLQRTVIFPCRIIPPRLLM